MTIQQKVERIIDHAVYGARYLGDTRALRIAKKIHLLYQKEIVKEKKEMMEEFIKFMKGKIIDMPVGSGFPLVIKEGHLRNLFAHKKLDKNI